MSNENHNGSMKADPIQPTKDTPAGYTVAWADEAHEFLDLAWPDERTPDGIGGVTVAVADLPELYLEAQSIIHDLTAELIAARTRCSDLHSRYADLDEQIPALLGTLGAPNVLAAAKKAERLLKAARWVRARMAKHLADKTAPDAAQLAYMRDRLAEALQPSHAPPLRQIRKFRAIPLDADTGYRVYSVQSNKRTE